jgi:hypothetical protein
MKTKNDNNKTTNDASPAGDVGTTHRAERGDALARLEAENAELRSNMRLGNARSLLTSELAKAGARSPELLFDAAKGDLQFAEDGTLTNAAAIVERLEDAFPEQFADEPPIGSIDGGAGRASVPALTKDALAKMSPAEIARLDWAAVRQALTEK